MNNISKRPIEENAYNGFSIRARANVHSMILDMIDTLPISTDSLVIDMGAGEGSFCLRLQDAGYTSLEACEIVPQRFQLPSILCHAVDLNTINFDRLFTEKYSLVIAVELIEHLENPANFFRSVFNVLQPGGYLIVTTPNVSSWYSRILSLRTGQLHWFDETSCIIDGHISPLFSWQIKYFCESSGLQIVEQQNTKGFFLRQRYLQGTLRTRFLYWGLKHFMQGSFCGEICLWIAHRRK